jgi:hypothetical protein
MLVHLTARVVLKTNQLHKYSHSTKVLAQKTCDQNVCLLSFQLRPASFHIWRAIATRATANCALAQRYPAKFCGDVGTTLAHAVGATARPLHGQRPQHNGFAGGRAGPVRIRGNARLTTTSFKNHCRRAGHSFCEPARRRNGPDGRLHAWDTIY